MLRSRAEVLSRYCRPTYDDISAAVKPRQWKSKVLPKVRLGEKAMSVVPSSLTVCGSSFLPW